ncbi:MAG TPA: hypothetical protein VJT15_25190 [Pyrinomonadaceae bacterium]|nr:hypothetical protein [Pyrinomonadaceae bacterium]
MSIFTPPTDNLYKFVALSGIVLFLAGFLIPPVFFQETGMEYLKQLRGSDELQVQERFVNQRLETLKLRERQAIDERDKLQKRLVELNAASNSPEVEKLEGRIKEANREVQSIADASYELSLSLELKRAQVNSEDTVSFNRRRDSRVFLVGGWIVGFIGFFIFAPIGFVLWYKKLQRHQDLVCAKEAQDKLAAAPANKRIEREP